MFTHIDSNNDPTMVDISDKEMTHRAATAKGLVYIPDELGAYFADNELITKKGPVFQTAIIAATQAVKKTYEVVPFCHPLLIDSIKVKIEKIEKNYIEIQCTVKTFGKTGIEIEALHGVQIAALTIYDMCKAVTHNMKIENVSLIQKSGGKSDFSSI